VVAGGPQVLDGVGPPWLPGGSAADQGSGLGWQVQRFGRVTDAEAL